MIVSLYGMLVKNNNLLEDICEVSLQSVWGKAFPVLAPIYSTLSKIQWNWKDSKTAEGVIYDNELLLSYPGLNQNQFKELDKLLRGMFLVRVRTEHGNIYELAGTECPMEASVKFNGGQTAISFTQQAIEPIKFIGTEADPVEELGFPYTLTFTMP
ncbi:hypothetical protein E0K83_03870 [Gramella sp. BOM4]|nr:hypothetical protein [Christiangramia bathymodioli]